MKRVVGSESVMAFVSVVLLVVIVVSAMKTLIG